jgi:hypothetical protein
MHNEQLSIPQIMGASNIKPPIIAISIHILDPSRCISVLPHPLNPIASLFPRAATCHGETCGSDHDRRCPNDRMKE